RVARVAVAALSELDGGDRRLPPALGPRRLALGRRALDVESRSCALRIPPRARRTLPWAPAPADRVDRRDAPSARLASGVWPALLAQPRTPSVPERSRVVVRRPGRRQQRHLDRPRPRPRGRRALDRQAAYGRVHRARPRGRALRTSAAGRRAPTVRVVRQVVTGALRQAQSPLSVRWMAPMSRK